MKQLNLNPLLYRNLVALALEEDLGRGGDLTSESTVPRGKMLRGQIIARQSGRLSGLAPALAAFRLLDPEIEAEKGTEDGQSLRVGSSILLLRGRVRTILSAERVALNFLGHLSGIATLTAAYVDAIASTKARIIDTRKTTPGLRALEKYAVRCGGGANHRMGLDDAILIKDNHIIAAGGVASAIKSARSRAPHCLKVEVEVDNIEQLREALPAGPDIILLDNMDTETLEEAVAIIDGRALIEASGGISLETAAEIAATGVDYLSVGALTHSAPALDVSLELDVQESTL